MNQAQTKSKQHVNARTARATTPRTKKGGRPPVRRSRTPNVVLVATSKLGPDSLDDALEQCGAEMAAIPVDELVKITVDVPTAVQDGLANFVKISAHRDAIVEHLPTFDLAFLDNFKRYAFGLLQAHALYIGAATVANVATLYDEALRRRDALLGDVTALSKRGLIDADRVAEFRGQGTYKTVGLDLVGLTNLVRQGWEKIEGKTALTLEEIEAARSLAMNLVSVVGIRDRTPAEVAEASNRRLRIFTLYANAYDELRSAIAYVRRKEGDADTIAPSLYAGRGGSSRKSDTPTPPAVGTSPSSPPPATAGGSSATESLHVSVNDHTPAPGTVAGPMLLTAAPATHVDVGMPGAHPFA